MINLDDSDLEIVEVRICPKNRPQSPAVTIAPRPAESCSNTKGERAMSGAIILASSHSSKARQRPEAQAQVKSIPSDSSNNEDKIPIQYEPPARHFISDSDEDDSSGDIEQLMHQVSRTNARLTKPQMKDAPAKKASKVSKHLEKIKDISDKRHKGDVYLTMAQVTDALVEKASKVSAHL